MVNRIGTKILVCALLLALGGCRAETIAAKESLDIIGGKRTAGKSVAGSKSGPGCELKNGPIGCSKDGKAVKPQKTTYSKKGPCRVADQWENETVAEWKKRDPAGIACLIKDNERQLAEIAEINAWNEKNERLEAQRKKEARQLVSRRVASSDMDTSGTWYCDTWDGSGAYGVYQMRHNPRFNPATCKKVD